MPIYYFEIETKQTGWIRMEAKSRKEAVNDIKENGFEVYNVIESDVKTEVVSIEGGEEED
jgi:hypothetical protein